MTNCQNTQIQLDDYLDATLGSQERDAFERHIGQCASCAEQVAEAESLQANLSRLSVPPMRPGFAQQAIAAASTEKKSNHRNGFVAGFSSALVASLALFVVFFGFESDVSSPVSADIPEIAISLGQPQTINLVFDVAYAMNDATLTIDLPRDVEIIGFPGQTQLAWQTSLKQGRNILPLPLTGRTLLGGELTASIESGSRKKSIRVHITVNNEIAPQAQLAPGYST